MIPVNEPLLSGNEARYVEECLRTGWISSSGQFLERFEASWSQYCGRRFGITVTNGSAALEVALQALELQPGDEVILPSFTIISCANAVVKAGATPVVVDCDPDTFTMDPAAASAAVSERTKAIMPVHLYGHPVEMDPILRLARELDLYVIEDAAEAHGAEYLSNDSGNPEWRRCGSFGDISTFSFFANKLVTTGEGGMVVTDNTMLAERCRSLRNLCFKANRRFHHDELGHNLRLTNLQAAIGVAQVERIDEILARKRQMGALYTHLLCNVPGIRVQSVREWARVNYWMYGIVLNDEVDFDAFTLAERLRNLGVETRPFFMGMHEQPALRNLGLFGKAHCPVTERLYRRGLYLPSGVAITEEQIEASAAALIRALS